MSAYPLPRPVDDPRFTLGLVFDVAGVLSRAGYPDITSGADLVRLQQALFGFVYASTDPAPAVVEAPPQGGHPAWCARGDCEQLGHMSNRLQAGDGDESTGVDVALVQVDTDHGPATAYELGVTEPGPAGRRSWLISQDQGDDLASALTELRRRAAGR